MFFYSGLNADVTSGGMKAQAIEAITAIKTRYPEEAGPGSSLKTRYTAKPFKTPLLNPSAYFT
ncbi:MAG: hypothetical protein ACXWUF_09700 [Methylomagnum sp.]